MVVPSQAGHSVGGRVATRSCLAGSNSEILRWWQDISLNTNGFIFIEISRERSRRWATGEAQDSVDLPVNLECLLGIGPHIVQVNRLHGARDRSDGAGLFIALA